MEVNFYKQIEYFWKNPEKEIETYWFWVHEAFKKEQSVFQKSTKMLDNGTWSSYAESYKWKFYNFELLVEMFNRFYIEMNVSERSLKYLNAAAEDLKLSYRFQLLWYYNTSGMHLRWFSEKMIHFVIYYYIDIWKLKEYEIKKNGRKSYFIEKSLKEKIKACLEIWDFSYLNTKNKWKDIYDEFYFPLSQFLQVYKYLSFWYIHDWKPESKLEFIVHEFKKIDLLLKLTYIFTAHFIKVTIWELIEEFWVHKVEKRLDDRYYYRNYLQMYFNENKFTTNQYSFLYNCINDDKDNLKFAFWDLWLEKSELFSEHYLEQTESIN